MSLPCVVCVPARNEEQRLPLLLAALARQEGLEPLRVVLLLNNCTDGSAEAARACHDPRLRLRVVERHWPQGNVGLARDAAMRAGMDWLREEASAGILASTDADAVPPPHWIAATLSAFDNGAELVGGQIRIEGSPPEWLRVARDRVEAYWSAVRDLAHALDPLDHDPPPRHGDHTGGSLAITLEAYEMVGGFPSVASQEDVMLVRALEREGGRVVHPASVWTEVSAREDGRAEGGMAGEMARWRHYAETGEPHLLPDAAFWLSLFQRRRALRRMFLDQGFHALHGVEGPALRELAGSCRNDIAFVARADDLLPALPCGMAEIREGTTALRQLARGRLAA